ncbi:MULTISPECIES: formate-dependent phosphoribosylglycinamide formyltransferase [Paenibacillus]|uniref:Formate-dependent phosphoribosylglycinamide formyltransferase n=1 Tax=Paenibacillus polymyxa TaxID=1406 RepID=A0A8I1LPF1_PAEPO|nr:MULTISPECIES: formate-dependent phosphoribosylglycinamide formyltransferase [Paenibacillus]KAF6575050.1 formate-dependent phosphoribosylglycinamide formyltransferase [Paenibacillus sp. EKM206P]KAF6590276.1 formate-dependent phosphoribosylglycinamide formyltransferase [Paenibacillus sp. EKM205P]MBM0632366.1 formate-dependent phosphoribosylglycinamide formyltransferase [Paenibacillus polymyxa]UMY52735.1 formate-dependent phosphoribosylglycinamide formyltransferase [Paenibacillus peoriae]
MWGAPFSAKAKKMLLLGSGELGKEVIIEAQRLGVECIAVDRYELAPAMQVAHRSHCLDMQDAEALKALIREEKPDIIVPEIEAIATGALEELEQEGFHVVPTARAARLTMDREGIRRLAAEKLQLPTAAYRFADNFEQLRSAVHELGTPCVVKPLMSSSGKGQSVCRAIEDAESCWNTALEGARAKTTRVIVEAFVPFESEITLLTVRSVSGTTFCPPIGHIQKDGDYVESWQPHGMTDKQLSEAEDIARTITDELGGYGLFGVELFLTTDGVIFSEVSPRPHDTGMVTMITQDLSEFALHVRAILGFPVPSVTLLTPGASATLKAEVATRDFVISGLHDALLLPRTQVRVFGKPETKPGRRMAVALSAAEDVETARKTAEEAANMLKVEVNHV